jgi:DNA modification methylase
VRYYADETITLHHGDSLDVLRTLPDASVDCCVTSPPYFGLRDYGVDGQIGAEASPAEFVDRLRVLFAEVRRVLADDGTLWLNLGDSYSTRKVIRDSSHQPGMHADRTDHDTIGRTWVENRESGAVRMPSSTGLPEKNLLGIPWRVAFALQDDGWILRNSIIWHKLTAMPEPVRDRLSTRHENLFLFSKLPRYWFDLDPIREALTYPDAADGSRVFGGVNKAASLTAGSSARRTGNTYGQRPQRLRAEQIFKEKGLTDAHREAIRAVGITDVGKAATTQSGAGKSRPEVQALADEAKAALGGYYREFMTPAGKNPGDVWSISAEPFPGAHFATFPSEIPRRCISAGCKPGGTVLDPFSGSGTTGMVAQKLGRKYVGIDLNADYLDLSLRTRLANGALNFGDAS